MLLSSSRLTLHRRDLPAGEADDEQPALAGQAAQRVGEPVAADRVDDDVDARAAGQLLRPRRGSRRRARPRRRRRRAPPRPSPAIETTAIDAGAERRGQLDGRGADAAGGAVHEHRLARLQRAAPDEREVHGQVVHRQRRARLEGHARRAAGRPGAGRRRRPRRTRRGRERGDPVAGPRPPRPRAPARTTPATSEPGHERQVGLTWYSPRLCSTSGKVTPAACTSIRPGRRRRPGSSTSATSTASARRGG